MAEIGPVELDRRVYFKKSHPTIAYPSFEALIKACPECSIDHQNYEPYYCMDESAWKVWMETGTQPTMEAIV